MEIKLDIQLVWCSQRSSTNAALLCSVFCLLQMPLLPVSWLNVSLFSFWIFLYVQNKTIIPIYFNIFDSMLLTTEQRYDNFTWKMKIGKSVNTSCHYPKICREGSWIWRNCGAHPTMGCGGWASPWEKPLPEHGVPLRTRHTSYGRDMGWVTEWTQKHALLQKTYPSPVFWNPIRL